MSIESFREKRKCLGRSFQIRPTRPVHATRCRPVHPSVARASKKGSRSGIIFQRTFWRHFRLGFVFVRLRRRDRVFCFFFFGNSGDSTCRPELINISLVCSWHWGLLDPVVANCGFVPCMPCTNNASRETVPFETDSFYWKPDIFTRISRFSKGVSSRFSFWGIPFGSPSGLLRVIAPGLPLEILQWITQKVSVENAKGDFPKHFTELHLEIPPIIMA